MNTNEVDMDRYSFHVTMEGLVKQGNLIIVGHPVLDITKSYEVTSHRARLFLCLQCKCVFALRGFKPM